MIKMSESPVDRVVYREDDRYRLAHTFWEEGYVVGIDKSNSSFLYGTEGQMRKNMFSRFHPRELFIISDPADLDSGYKVFVLRPPTPFYRKSLLDRLFFGAVEGMRYELSGILNRNANDLKIGRREYFWQIDIYGRNHIAEMEALANILSEQFDKEIHLVLTTEKGRICDIVR